MSTRLLAFCMLALASVACGVTPGATAGAAPAGVTGRVTQTPAGPGPQRIGQDESGAPVAAVTVELRTAKGVAASARTGADGSFSLQAPPGAYTLHVNVEGMYPRCPDQPVTVKKGGPVQAELRCDSGMR